MSPAVMSALITFYSNMFNLDRYELSCSVKLATNYKVSSYVPGYRYGVGLIDEKTVRAWDLDRYLLVNNGYYSYYYAAYYFNFIKQSYKQSDFTTWQCGFVSKYTNRSAFCVDYMIKFRACLKEKKGVL